MKAFVKVALLFGSVVTLVLGGAMAASADEVNDAATALQQSNVYVESGVAVENVDGLKNAYANSDIGIAILSGDTVSNNTNWTASTAAEYILNNTHDRFNTVILANDGNSPFVVVGKNADKVSEILYKNAGGDLGTQLMKDSKAFFDEGSHSAASGGKIGDDARIISEQIGIFALWAAVLGIVLLFVLVAIRIFIRSRKESPQKIRAVTSKAVDSDTLKKQMEKLANISVLLTKADASEMATTSQTIIRRLNELFTRIARRGGGSQLKLAQVEYTSQLSKLNDALGVDYFLDIISKPQLWDNPEVRKDEVRKAANAIDDQILENIKQVNSFKDLDFRVALESIISSADAPKANKMIGD